MLFIFKTTKSKPGKDRRSARRGTSPLRIKVSVPCTGPREALGQIKVIYFYQLLQGSQGYWLIVRGQPRASLIGHLEGLLTQTRWTELESRGFKYKHSKVFLKLNLKKYLTATSVVLFQCLIHNQRFKRC